MFETHVHRHSLMASIDPDAPGYRRYRYREPPVNFQFFLDMCQCSHEFTMDGNQLLV